MTLLAEFSNETRMTRRMSAGQRVLAGVDEGALSATWRMTMRQLSVYLRLLDVPLPGSYGPTADG